ncbi:hypothetical protein AB0M39_19605 [Streptomyces sp. NPDC051907]|uniref:hypothetical protein n=1 Tax=Streptomyces sp. NPDC051907 TaxID=3155284 RepID=UPI0034490FAC
MHSYDPPRQPYQSQIPSMRPSHESMAAPSSTPIYDALYSEYLRSFKALPGDRSGEEDLGFKGFGGGLHNSRGGTHTGHSSSGGWQPIGRVHPTSHLPAALPPGPRRGM